MPAKKATTGAARPKAAAAPVHGRYKEMVRHAIIKLKERNGSNRAKLKQYVLANNKGLESGASFDNMFNKAIKGGVDKGEFAQPKGPSGTVKLAKKEPAAPKPAATAKKPAATKKATKTAAPKKTTPFFTHPPIHSSTFNSSFDSSSITGNTEKTTNPENLFRYTLSCVPIEILRSATSTFSESHQQERFGPLENAKP